MISVLISPANRSPAQNDKARQITESFLKEQGISDVGISLKLVSPREMRQLNKKYRGMDEPTTILTFSQQEKKSGQAFPKPLRILGDIVICLEEAKRQKLSLEQLLRHGLKNLINEQPDLLSQVSSSKNLRT